MRRLAWDHSWSVLVPGSALALVVAATRAEHGRVGNENALTGSPAYLDKAGLARFQGVACQDSDVFMVSYPKCGTTWLHQILFCLLRMDEDGEFGGVPLDKLVGSSGQVYPDGVPSHRSDGRNGTESQRAAHAYAAPKKRAIFQVYSATRLPDEDESIRSPSFGGWSVEDLVAQPSPRLFSSHIKASNLPTSLFDSKARLVLCERSPKAALLSGYHFIVKLDAAAFPALRRWFRGGLDSHFDRFIAVPKALSEQGCIDRSLPDVRSEKESSDADDEAFGCGDFFSFHADLTRFSLALGPGRSHVVQYESLTTNFDAEVRSLAVFLNVELSDSKLAALRKRTSLWADLGAEPTVATARTGQAGDECLTVAQCAQLDKRAASSAAASAVCAR